MKLWNEKSKLWLLTPAEFEQLPDGTKLTCVNGKSEIKGGNIDMDIRFGHIAWGIHNPLEHELKHLFLIFGLTQ